jgi:predicted PurR-regulated permease PerM
MDGIENGPEQASTTKRSAYARPPILTARALVLLIPAAIALVLLIIAAPALWTFMVGTLYMVAVYPAVQAMARRGLNRGVAILVVFAVTLALIALFVLFVAGPLVGQLAAFVAALPASS